MPAIVSRFVAAEDGLRLHVRQFGEPGVDGLLPVVCLPGLARTAGDFEELATALTATGRLVLALDYRGRGGSDRDPDPRNYALPIEARDVVSVVRNAGIDGAIFIGTSRGGLVTMLLAGGRPDLVRGAVLNDIGPVLEPEGMARIKGYVGKLPRPGGWDDAVALLEKTSAGRFPAASKEDWRRHAALTFEERDGRLFTRYDPALATSLEGLDLTKLPTLWEAFDGLAGRPLLVVRGEHSDLLSPGTAQEMIRRHPGATLLTVAGQGHAPFLTDAPTVGVILDFVASCDARPETFEPA